MTNLLGPDWNSYKSRNAIILCTGNEIKDALSYTQVIFFQDTITKYLIKHVKKKNLFCMGLKMNHNIYIPSIIISLKVLDFTFIFLNENKDNSETISKLHIKWILSFNKNCGNIIEKIWLKNNDFLYLSRLENESPTTSTNYENIFYVIKTSGTTGENKLIHVENECILDNIKSLQEIFKITFQDVIFFGTPLTFDPSIVELLLALQTGACLLIVPQNHKTNYLFLYETLFPSSGGSNNGITTLQTVPSLFLLWPEEKIRKILLNPQLRILALGGEAFPERILQFPRHQHLEMFNLYGITEVSCWASCYEINFSQNKSNNKNIPIGEWLGDTLIELRDESGIKINGNGEGEIFIGSHSRRCRIGRETNTSRPVFRATGDYAQIKNKQIYYLCRKNDIVKRFGTKIKLSQVEETVSDLTGWESKCVWSKKNSKLLCFLKMTASNYDADLNKKILDKVRVQLLHKLPPEQFPDFFEMLLKFPTTAHGKINRKKLEEIYDNSEKIQDQSADVVFKQLLEKYFGNDQNFECSFFELGGSSILAIQIISEFASCLNIEYPSEFVSVLFEKNLKSCLDFLKTFKTPRINKPESDSVAGNFKKQKTKQFLKIRWKYNLKACVDASPLPFRKDKETFVAVGSFSHFFVVLNAETGEELAKFALPDAVESSATLSPSKNQIFIGCFDGKMYCLSLQNQINWSYATGDRIKCTSILCKRQTCIVFGSYDKKIHCVRITDGVSAWTTSASAPITATPLLCHQSNKLFLATILGECFCLNEENGEVLWKFKSGSPIFGAPSLYNNSTVWPNVIGNVFCLNSNGEKIWEFSSQGHIYSSIVVHENCVIFSCHDSKLYVIRENAEKKAEIVSVNDFNSGKITPTPFVSRLQNGKEVIVVCSNSGLVRLLDVSRRDDIEVIREINLSGDIFSSPFLFEDKIYVGCRDDHLYCLEM